MISSNSRMYDVNLKGLQSVLLLNNASCFTSKVSPGTKDKLGWWCSIGNLAFYLFHGYVQIIPTTVREGVLVPEFTTLRSITLFCCPFQIVFPHDPCTVTFPLTLGDLLCCPSSMPLPLSTLLLSIRTMKGT